MNTAGQSIELTWLGQAGFIIDAGHGLRVLIDPFMSEHDSRLYPPPSLDQLGVIDWLLVTHEHLDHLDLDFVPKLIAQQPEVRVVLPEPIASQVAGIVDTEHLIPVQPGDTIELADQVTVEVIPAYHAVEVSDGYSDGSGEEAGGRFVGYLLRTPSRSIYHAGDTIVTAELLAALIGAEIDVAMLPINGREFFREEAGLVGNMNYRDAVSLAVRTGADTLIPMHWDLFAGNTERPSAVVDEVASRRAKLHVLTLARLAPFRLS